MLQVFRAGFILVCLLNFQILFAQTDLTNQSLSPTVIAAESPAVPPSTAGLVTTQAAATATSTLPAAPNGSEAIAFKEIWAYVMANDQTSLRDNLPLTDVFYFAAGINGKGELFGGGALPRQVGNATWRRHLVVADISNSGLVHFVLTPDFPLRDKFIKDLGAKAKDYDGVQIDFEAIADYDRQNFLQFLSLLKTELGTKTLSIALPARTKAVGDAFDYAAISAIVDRVFIMAYDEHWSGSKPGAIASLQWCGAVADYAVKTVGLEKLVMGLPFYGRVWGEKNPAGSYRFPSMDKLIKENSATLQRDAEGIPFFNFSTTINYTAYFEDLASLAQRSAIYRKAGVDRIGFWRLGQEDAAIWDKLKVAK